MDISLDGLNKPVTFCRDVHYKRANSGDHSRLEMPSCGHQWNEDGEVAACNPGQQTN
jgi:hypothetical protein